MIKCIIVDDEQHAIELMELYVSQTPYLQLVGTTTNPIEALQLVNSQPVDLIFLDIQMPELSGIDFVRAIQGKTKVILTTAYSEFAIESYELEVVDYLLKPIRLPRFLQAVQKVVKELKEENIADETMEDEDYLFVKIDSKRNLLKINLSDIDYIEGMKNYVAIFHANQKTVVYTSMKELEVRLPKKQFMRVQKSFIIAIHKIKMMEGNVLRLKGVNAEIQIGENYRSELMQMIKNKLL